MDVILSEFDEAVKAEKEKHPGRENREIRDATIDLWFYKGILGYSLQTY
jgi:hypothetical protein